MTDETTEPTTDETNEAEEVEEVETTDPETPPEEPETFPRAYVEELRQEAAKHRTRAGDRDDLAQRLHAALVTATGRLADPTDMPFDEAHLRDEEALTAALDDLLTRKPHLASRRPVGDVGQGASEVAAPVDLAGILRSHAN